MGNTLYEVSYKAGDGKRYKYRIFASSVGDALNTQVARVPSHSNFKVKKIGSKEYDKLVRSGWVKRGTWSVSSKKRVVRRTKTAKALKKKSCRRK